MKASLDTNVIIHFYKAGLEDILFDFFDEGVIIYEQIRNIELENHGQEVLNKVDSDISSGKIELYTDQKLKDLQIYKIFEYNFSENRNLYGTGDLGEVYAISLAQTLGAYSLVTDDTKQGGPYMSLLQFEDGEKAYILAPIGLKVGSKVMAGKNADIKPGNCMKIENIPVGTMIHNIELNPGQGGKLVRAAGQEAQLMAKEGKYAHVRLPSGEMRLVMAVCKATIGTVGNTDHENIKIGKAGRSRHMGIRPTVRGSVMNPVDHPHGGGEGKAPVGHAGPMTPWGKPALGYKTRKKNKKSDKLITKRRKPGQDK